jgi:F-type H+-transporting ATPase subunit epsilon
MEDGQMQMEIVTPQGSLLRGAVDMVEFPSQAGELGIYPGHVPLLVDLAAGALRVHKGGQEELFAVAGGYVQIYGGLVRVVATFAITDEEAKAVDEACQRARAALETAQAEPPAKIAEELETLKAELLFMSEHKARRHK